MAPEITSNTTAPDEFQQIMEHIHNGHNFLLSGGAGSGKTYSLVQVIQKVLEKYPHVKIACITYTNAAVREIEDRIHHDNLKVSTIHDFLWDNIKNFQKELKKSLLELINDPEITKIKISGEETIADNFFDNCEEGIQYKEYLKLREGIISHDELLVVANYLFKTYPKLRDILKDKFKFIFIDEYQDTHKEVIEIFLDYLDQSSKENVIGFFGDAMQSIYDDRIGNLDEYIRSDKIKEVKKEQNRRNPQLIIDLANRLRTDGIRQIPSEDLNAPNMEDGQVKTGRIQFFYSESETGLLQTREALRWSFDDSTETKELNLTHNLIADKAEFRNLMDIYDKDQVLKFKDKVKKHIRDNGITEDFSEKSFREVIETLSISPSRGKMQDFIDEHQDLYNYANDLNWGSFSKMYVDKDQLLDDKKQDEEDENKQGSKRDNLIKHLFKIQNTISLYQENQYNEFLRRTDYKINTIQDKRDLKNIIENLVEVGDKTIEEIINEANDQGICKIDEKLEVFKAENSYIYDRVKLVKFKEFQKLYNYLEGKTPFSTQHKIKGAEFNNVLVILDNGGWNNYNFESLFLSNGLNSVLERTQKIFYVCCTRAKENLAVYYQNPSSGVIEKAKEWFGEIHKITV